MAGASGKSIVKLVLPADLKEALDAEAQARGMDRSALICAQLLAFAEESPEPDETSIQRRLDQVLRDHVALREQLSQIVTLIETFMASVAKPATPAAQVYPTPATLEETYPELYAPPAPPPVEPVTVAEAPVKKWPWRR
jgi:hypothetical protein